MTETYLCASCRAEQTRPYQVRYFVAVCPECGEHARFVHADLVDAAEQLPAADRPDDWADRSLDERVLYALEEGAISATSVLR
ncbi:hypothetical protein [Halobaculum sp. P14]|uniref:hypothetical protein n=1 Tax=Halobaculum sp. P14 TaxID=3421638 RepID=UPI003EC058DA